MPIGACWEEMFDPGRYDFGDNGIDWGAVVQGRPLLRAPAGAGAALRAEYAFVFGCQSDGCRARF